MPRKKGKMLSIGLTSFLQGMEQKGTEQKGMCQCPQSGSLHFYGGRERAQTQTRDCVNALSRAHFISTLNLSNEEIRNDRRVNALSRAHFISTLD